MPGESARELLLSAGCSHKPGTLKRRQAIASAADARLLVVSCTCPDEGVWRARVTVRQGQGAALVAYGEEALRARTI